jgi:hypothetical protein
MASGHVNRVNRPDTWLHRPMLRNVKKALANPEPSTNGTFRTLPSTVDDVRSREQTGSGSDRLRLRLLTHNGQFSFPWCVSLYDSGSLHS